MSAGTGSPMVIDDKFEAMLASMRPRLHRYCARMVGSAVDGEDLVQEVLIRAVTARSGGTLFDNIEAWMFRVAHNASLDLLRRRARASVVPLEDEMLAGGDETVPQIELASMGFRAFMGLPALPRCAVVLKDVLGHTIEEIAEIAGCSAPAAKSALQRGRVRLREIIARQDRADALLPLIGDEERRTWLAYVDAFRAGDFDSIRRMLSDDVSLDLVQRLQLTGRDRVDTYFTRYAEAKHWRYAFGAIDGRPAMLVYDDANLSDRPAHFVVIDWAAGAIVAIRDFFFVPYVMEGADCVLLG
jgi:RNA polymerase sigma factor (sigma-70 family)